MSVDPMHKMAMDAIGFAAQILTIHADHLGQFIEAEQRMHSFMHITDPTMYREALHSDSLRQQVVLAKAALAFILEVQKVKAEITVTVPAHD